jgi:hypothetical protein
MQVKGQKGDASQKHRGHGENQFGEQTKPKAGRLFVSGFSCMPVFFSLCSLKMDPSPSKRATGFLELSNGEYHSDV